MGGKNLQRNLDTSEQDDSSEQQQTENEGEVSNSDVEDPDDDVLRQTDQRHNSTMGNSVAMGYKGKAAIASVNSFSLANGVGDINRKESAKKLKQNMQNVIEENSD
jgi:hypothetical protein